MSLIFLFVFLVFAKVDGLNTCNFKILKNIKETNGCPRSVINKVQNMSPLTTAFGPIGSVPNTVKCTAVAIDNTTSPLPSAYVTYYKKKGEVPTVVVSSLKEDACGHVFEYDTTGKEYQVYDLNVNHVLCYYKCTFTESEGPDLGACAVPVNKINDKNTLAAVKLCKKKLKKVGVTSNVMDLEFCKK